MMAILRIEELRVVMETERSIFNSTRWRSHQSRIGCAGGAWSTCAALPTSISGASTHPLPARHPPRHRRWRVDPQKSNTTSGSLQTDAVRLSAQAARETSSFGFLIWMVPIPSNSTFLDGLDTACPAWSPNGQLIVFSSNAEGDFDIYAVSVGGGKPKRLTTNPAMDICPSVLTRRPADLL